MYPLVAVGRMQVRDVQVHVVLSELKESRMKNSLMAVCLAWQPQMVVDSFSARLTASVPLLFLLTLRMSGTSKGTPAFLT